MHLEVDQHVLVFLRSVDHVEVDFDFAADGNACGFDDNATNFDLGLAAEAEQGQRLLVTLFDRAPQRVAPARFSASDWRWRSGLQGCPYRCR